MMRPGAGWGTPSDVGCDVLHVDMDAFYASVAVRDRPDLAGQPVIVGGQHRGVVLSASYPAREAGVRSAMPMTRARRLCPRATVLPPDFEALSGVSAAVLEVFRTITPVVEVLSLDEAFLDVSGARRRLGSPAQIADQLRARIWDEQSITCSVGVAATKHVAKLASRRAKPDGVVVVPAGEETAFLHPLDVAELWGVGDKTATTLRRLGLNTVGDLAHTPLPILRRALGPALSAHLHDLAWGTDDRIVVPCRGPEEPERSIGADETFSRDTDDPAVVVKELLRLSAKVAGRVRAARVAGRTVTVKIRFADFTTITRSRTLRDATDVTAEIYQTASDLYLALGLERARIRLVGVRLEGLMDAAKATRQMMFGEREHGWSYADRAVDQAVMRFGRAAVTPATLLDMSRRG
jgi:DNA polymerase IV